MIEFYSELQQGRSKAEAIRAASIKVRERRPHPYHWAPFLLIGKG
jgi:CHAT domain-containing protein